jgi:RNA polymerase sigma-70 factor (ECF subfamily)
MGGFTRSIPNSMALDLPQMNERATDALIESLVREHARLVFRIGYSVLRNHAEAEDVVQEVFLRVSKHGARGIDDSKAWISRIAWRVAVDRYRSSIRASHEEYDERQHAMVSNFPGTERVAISREMLDVLDRLIATLPGKERAALLLTSVEELSSAEAALVLGTSETSVRARVFRARQRLQQKMQKLFGKDYVR